MQIEKPKALPSFAPQLEDDFLIAGRWKLNQKNDVKVIKRKIKKAEKETMRELKKDTMSIQNEKKRQATLRKGNSKVFRGGNAPKDEI